MNNASAAESATESINPTDWQTVTGLDQVVSPALLVDTDHVRANIQHMLSVVDHQAARLRPHVKTHKMSAVLRLQRDAGIEQFKAATLAEAEMVARAGAADCLLAQALVGPKIQRFDALAAEFPGTRFSAIVDHPDGVLQLSDGLSLSTTKAALPVWIDVDCGMHRTGVPFGERLDAVRDAIAHRSNLQYAGLHVYDGHLHQSELEQRERAATEIMAAIRTDRQQTHSPQVIVGGSPTFAFWAQQTDWQCSPGTMVLWDAGYASSYADMRYQLAAALLTRVISKPQPGRVCLDLGHKAVASEMPLAERIVLPALPEARFVSQSEEHLVIETTAAEGLPIGAPLLAFPRHICPTIALYSRVWTVTEGRVTGEAWPVDARQR